MNALNSLKDRLSDNNTLLVQNENGFVMETEFIFNPGATEEDIDNLRNNNIILPDSFIEFLKICNGAVLFKDKKYGQWGCQICGTNDLIDVNIKIRKWRPDFKDSWVVFACWLGDQDILIFDMEKYLSSKKKYILDGDECDAEDEFSYINGDFDKIIDRLIVSQGSKYWRWT